MGAWDDGGGYSVSQSQSYKIVPLKDRAAGAEEKLAFRYVLKGPDGERVVSLLSPFIEFKNAGLDVRYTIAPTLSVVAEAFGYRVSWPSVTNATYPNYIYTEIYESKTLSNFTVAQLTNAAVVSKGNSQANSISIAADLVKRYVRVRHVGYSNGQLVYTPLSNVVEVTPTDPVAAAIDSVPPAEIIINSSAWSGNNISLNITFANDVKRFQISLTNGSNTSYYTKYPTAGVTTETIVISEDEQYSSFGQLFSSYSGVIKAADFAGNMNSGTSFTVGTRVNPLANITPTFTVTNITNGYTVTWVLPTGAFRATVHTGSLASFIPSSQNQVYSGQSPAIIKDTNYDPVYVKVIYYDRWGNQSLVSSGVLATPINSISADIIGPSAPTSVTAVQGLDSSGTVGFNGYLNISWPGVADSTLRGYRIRFRPVTTPSSEYSYVDSPGTGTIYRLQGLAVGATYEIGIAAYDEFNNTSTAYTSIGSNIQISGTPFIGTNVNTSGYFSAGAQGDTGEFRFGYGVATGKRGLVFNANNYWYIDSAQSALFKIGGSSDNYVSWNGTKLQVDGDLGVAGGTTIGGNIAMGASGASIYQGTLNGSGNLASDGFLLNSGGLTIKKGSVNLQLNTSDGGIYADYGRIAGWTIDSSKFEKVISSNYSGISSGGTYAFYAGSSSSGGDANAKFLVTPSGAVTARNLKIIGDGTTNKIIDSTNFYVRNDGYMEASSAKITGEINASTGTIGAINISNNSLWTGALGATAISGSRVVFNSGGISAYKNNGSSDELTFSIANTGSAQIAGWTINPSRLTSSGSYPMVIDSTNQKIVFAEGATDTFEIDAGTSVTTYSVTSYVDSGDSSYDPIYAASYTGWTASTSSTSKTNTIQIKKSSAGGAQPMITLSTVGTGLVQLYNSSSNGEVSEVSLSGGGIILKATKAGGLKIPGLGGNPHPNYSGAKYYYDTPGVYTFSTDLDKQVGRTLTVKSDGTIVPSRAFLRTASSETTITTGTYFPYVGRDGDILFSTGT
jgi:hypothetical protein